MVNKVTRSEQPELFEEIYEVFKEDSYSYHRKYGSFIKKSIVVFTEELRKYYPNVLNYDDYIGTWETNEYTYSAMGSDASEIDELTRVEKVPVMSYEWKPVETISEVEIPSV